MEMDDEEMKIEDLEDNNNDKKAQAKKSKRKYIKKP